MPSNSILRWRGPAQADLDDIVDAHASVAGSARGRRAATAQVTHAYAVLLSSHFQRFCRDLHTEAIDHLTRTLADPWARTILVSRLAEGRKLDSGNPNPGNIGSDFNRFQLNLWTDMARIDARTAGRRVRLGRLNRWRNAIAHQHFDGADLDLGGGRRDLRLGDVVTYSVGRSVVRARVIEDRGHIGVGGRQIVRIEVLGEEDFEEIPRRFDMAAAHVVLEQPAAK